MLIKRIMWVPLILTLAASVFSSSDTVSEAKGFLLTGPKQILAGTEETFCLHLQGVQSAGRVTFQVAHRKFKVFFGARGPRRIDPKVDDYNSCIPLVLYVPDKVESGTHELVLEVTWDDRSTDLKIQSRVPIVVSHTPTPLQLIQTDKAWYKPGQLVRVRTLALSHLLQTVVTPADRVWILDPNDTIVADWSNFTSNLGLAQHELQLSSQAVQGAWKIRTDYKGRIEQKGFEVKDFVLPSFGVKISGPYSVLNHAETFDLSVCAESTSGQPVLGHVDVVAKVLPRLAWFGEIGPDPTAEPVTLSGTLDKATGCHQIVFPLSRLGLGGDLWNTIEIKGHVTEEGTEEKHSASLIVRVAPETGSNVILETFSRSTSTFQVGLPYLAQGSLSEVAEGAGGKPIANAQVSVCVKEGYQNLTSTTGDPIQDSDVQQCVKVTTNQEGHFAYSVLPRNSEVVRLSFEAKYEDASKNISATTFTYAKPSYSPSGSFASIAPVGSKPVACDSKLTMKVHLNNVKVGQKLNLRHFVTGRGDILVKGAKEVQVAAIDVDLVGALDGSKSPVQVNAVEFEFQVTPTFHPKAAVMVFYVREDGEVVTAHTDFTVEECFPNAVTLKWDAESYNPGATAGLKLHSAPGSLCGLTVVDQRVSLIQPDSQLTAKTVLDLATTFTIEAYASPVQAISDYEYCEAVESTSTEATGTTTTESDVQGSWSSASHYQDAIEAFDSAGLLVISNWKMQTRPCYKLYTEHRPVILHGVPAPLPVPDTTTSTPAEVDSKEPETEVVAPVPLVDERVYLPETWLWEMYTTDSKGDTKVEQKLPNKKTAWVGRAFCVSSSAGFGMSADAKITAA